MGKRGPAGSEINQSVKLTNVHWAETSQDGGQSRHQIVQVSSIRHADSERLPVPYWLLAVFVFCATRLIPDAVTGRSAGTGASSRVASTSAVIEQPLSTSRCAASQSDF